MTTRLTKYEKETVLLYNQSRGPVTISTYGPGLRRHLREYAARYPELCRRIDKQKYGSSLILYHHGMDIYSF